MDGSDSSSLSSALSSGDERLAPIFLKAKGKGKAVKKHASSPATVLSPPRPPRAPSPPHDDVFEDNADIAVSLKPHSRVTVLFARVKSRDHTTCADGDCSSSSCSDRASWPHFRPSSPILDLQTLREACANLYPRRWWKTCCARCSAWC